MLVDFASSRRHEPCGRKASRFVSSSILPLPSIETGPRQSVFLIGEQTYLPERLCLVTQKRKFLVLAKAGDE